MSSSPTDRTLVPPTRDRSRGSGAAHVYAQLRAEILSLAVEPGTLLDETELAARFELSRSPVREALVRLSAEGLVTTLRNRSSIVAPVDVLVVPSYLDAVELLYRLTARLAALHRTSAQLAGIHEIHRRHTEATSRGDLAGMIDLNRDFHLAIARAGGNSFYAGWTQQILDHGQRIIGLYLRDLGEPDAATSQGWATTHGRLVAAIEAQDADEAEAVARQDASIVADRMRERFGSRPSGQLLL